jgi:hypothetical protein
MGERPPRTTLGRKDNDGPYCKSNCQWETYASQVRNSRHNHLITWNGKTQCVAAWAEEMGISKNTLLYRLKRRPLEWAMTARKGDRSLFGTGKVA